MSFDHTKAVYHLTPGGWVPGSWETVGTIEKKDVSPPPDRVESWLEDMYQASGWSPEEYSWRQIWVNGDVPQEERDRLREESKPPRDWHKGDRRFLPPEMWERTAAPETTDATGSPAPDLTPSQAVAELESAVAAFVDHFTLVFNHDWEHTKSRIQEPEFYIKENGTFINPGIPREDEDNNWANRGCLLSSYRRMVEVLDRLGIPWDRTLTE